MRRLAYYFTSMQTPFATNKVLGRILDVRRATEHRNKRKLIRNCMLRNARRGF